MGDEHWVPLLRLLHISDIHFVPFRPNAGPAGRHLIRRALSSVYGVPIPAWAQQGTTGHDPHALHLLRESIVRHVHADDEWNGLSALVVTGDLSTWGDQNSVEAVKKFADGVTLAADLRPPWFVYGNHDVWPGKVNNFRGLPFFASDSELRKNRTALRKRDFPRDFVERCPSPSLPTLSLNTIVHGRVDNMVALGYVQADRYWEHSRLKNQIDELKDIVKDESIAIVLSHHPVHDRSAWPKGPGGTPSLGRVSFPPPLSHCLSNARDVGKALSAAPLECALPVRIVLSGHLHVVYPPPGQLPAGAPIGHDPLPGNSVQLTVGTGAQASAPGNVVEQTWQVVQISRNQSGSKLRIGRIVFIRSGGAGPFVPISDDDDPSACVEEMVLDVG